MKHGRKTKVPPENRRVTSVPPSAIVSQLKFATVSDNLNQFADDFVHSFGIAVDLTLNVNDSFLLADSMALATGVSAEVADAFLFLDGFAGERGERVGLNDALSFGGDEVSVGKGIAIADSLLLADAIGLLLEYRSALSDTASLSDDLAVGYGLTSEDSIGLSDAIGVGLSQPVNDSFTLSDSLSLTVGLPISLSDTGSQSDSIAIGYGLASADQFVLTDALAAFGQIFLTIQDSIYNWDEFLTVIPQGVDFAITRSDALTFADSISLFSAGFKTFTEALSQSDAFALRGDGLIAFSDQFTLSDSASPVVDCLVSVSDNAANLNDAISLRGNGLIIQAESINNLTDAYAARGNGLLSFSEALGQSDAFSKIEGEHKTLSDSAIQPADGTARAISIWDIGVTGEQLSMSDAVTVTKIPTPLSQGLSDSFTLTDACSTKRGPTRWNDTIVVQKNSSTSLTQSLSDSLPAMADAQVNKFIRWRDSISVVKVNAGALNLSLSDTNTSMSEAVSTSRTQIGSPVSDVSVGLWSATPLWQKVDEFTASDADLIVSATNPSNDTCEVGLTTTTTDPVSSSNHIVSYRYAKSASGGRTIDLTVRLMQGTTIIATFSHTNIGNTVTQADQTLTGAQADSITNYGDLRLRFIANVSGSGSGRAGQITWAQFRCPK